MFTRSIEFAAVLALVAPCLAGTQTRTSAFEYDPATGLLTKEIIEPGDSVLCLVTTYIYDEGVSNGVGNRTSATTRNCNGTAPNEALAPTGDPVFESRTSRTSYGATVANPVLGQFPTSSTNALGHQELRAFDARFGSLTSLTGPNNLTTGWTYDSFGRKSIETRADGTVTNWFYERCADLVANTCPPLGQYRVRVTATGMPTSSTYYDSLNREIRAETQGFDGTLVMKDTQYDSLGRVAQVSRPYYSSATPAWTVFTLYDTLARVTQVDEPATSTGQARTVTDYNGMITTVTVSNAGASTGLPEGVTQSKITTKNSQGQVVQVKDTQNNTLTYTYDEFGNLKTTTDALGNVITLSYDLRGRKTQMIDPDMGTWTYFYNALGELIRQRDAKSQPPSQQPPVTMVYDLLGRMTNRTEPDLVSTWTYDTCTKGFGKLCQATATNSYSRTLSYDSLGRLQTLNSSIDVPYAVNTSYVLSGTHMGKVDTLTYPTGFGTRNIYNAFGYLSEVRVFNPNASPAFAADGTLLWRANTKSAGGMVTSELLGNNLTQTRTPDVLGRVSSVVAGSVHNLSYTYDPIGNVKDRTDSVNSVTENFTYDKLNRLRIASGTGRSGPLVTRNTDYNEIGSITYKSDVSTSIPGGTYSYPTSGVGSVRPHAVSSITGTVNGLTNPLFSYDANGNLTQVNGAGSNPCPTPLAAGERCITYMSFNLPSTIAGSAATYTYTYSPEHERVRLGTQLQTGTQTSIYLHPGGGGALFYEKEIKLDTSLEHKHYVQAGAILVGVYVTKSTYASGDGPQMRYYLKDNLGSIVAIANEAGAVAERLAYEAFGKRRFPDGTADPNNTIFGITTDRGFTGHEHLDELQLIHMNGRVYDPLLGRFITPDPTIQSADNLQTYNRYSYTANNPLSNTDPSGFGWGSRFRHFWHWAKQYDPLSNLLQSIHGTLHGNLAEAMQGSMHATSPISIWGDRYIRNHPSVAPYVEIVETTACTIVTYGVGAMACAAGVAAYNTSLLGGSNSDILRAGAISFATAYGMDYVGFVTDGHGVDSSYFLTANHVANIAGHALVGCASAAAGGGDCGSGAMSGAFGSLVTPLTSSWGPVGGFVAATVVGGTASELGGGSFANGAKTAAFGYLFNQSQALMDRSTAQFASMAADGQWSEYHTSPSILGDYYKAWAGLVSVAFVPEAGAAIPLLGRGGAWIAQNAGNIGGLVHLGIDIAEALVTPFPRPAIPNMPAPQAQTSPLEVKTIPRR
jgi:RHS repeat-associated protein